VYEKFSIICFTSFLKNFTPTCVSFTGRLKRREFTFILIYESIFLFIDAFPTEPEIVFDQMTMSVFGC
jgi:hypothetical protein